MFKQVLPFEIFPLGEFYPVIFQNNKVLKSKTRSFDDYRDALDYAQLKAPANATVGVYDLRTDKYYSYHDIDTLLQQYYHNMLYKQVDKELSPGSSLFSTLERKFRDTK